ncbi:MAG: aminotransferase class IV [Candidatus Hadarchaeales archaeon]
MRSFVTIDGKPVDGDLPLRSLFYGEGVFETFRWKGRPPVFFGHHLKRMERGCKFLCVPFSPKRIVWAVERTVELAGIDDARVKVCVVSLGPLRFSSRPAASRTVVLVERYRIKAGPWKCCIATTRRNSSSPLCKIKSLNYLENVVARRTAEGKGFDEAIFLNERAEVAEGTTTNIFWINDGRLFTPAIDCGALPGITRKVVMDLAKDAGVEVVEGCFKLKSLLNSQGAFLTNSIIGLVEIETIEKTQLERGGELIKGLRERLFTALGWK